MTPRRPALLAAYAALCALEIHLAGSSRPVLRRDRRLTKPLLMPVLAASLAAAPPGPRRTSTLLAQAFSWGGDVALLAKGTTPFVTGTTSFGLAHVAYTTGFVRDRDATRDLSGIPATRVLVAMTALTAPVMAYHARRKAPVLGPAVAAYSALLAAMAGTGQRVAGTQRQRLLTASGATLFLVSDTLLACRTFVLSDPPPELERLVMATYTLAQLLLSEGAVG